ncbi:VOC family protein [Acerihabitans sp. TG2]|uniref:VOC family protein n=1 Tax=Acerihabitans sp. TG2 TaxID=3096008 RepID=UPI002B22B8B0|nr:VOC family protein [Acerihabitans sp. TG2]MEA9390087.1 VOC family protein [Acerihabitans sp. TG2]
MNIAEKKAFSLDHVLVTPKDYILTLEQFRLLGFSPSPISYHPWGTATCFIMFADNFIELISVTDPDKLGTGAVNGFCFGRQMDAFARRGEEGISLIALHSKDVRQHFSQLAAKIPENQGVVDFRRPIILENGQPDEVVVSMALFIDQHSPDSSWFLCQQHRPDLIWQDQWRQHENGADAMLAVTYLVEDPAELAAGWQRLYGDRVRYDGRIAEVDTGSGVLRAIDLASAQSEYAGVALPAAASSRAHGISLRLHTASLEPLIRRLTTHGVAYHHTPGRVLVAPDAAGNVIIEFVQHR